MAMINIGQRLQLLIGQYYNNRYHVYQPLTKSCYLLQLYLSFMNFVYVIFLHFYYSHSSHLHSHVFFPCPHFFTIQDCLLSLFTFV